MPNSTTKTIAHGISSYSGIISLHGTAKNPTGGTTISLPYVNPSEGHTYLVMLRINGANIEIKGTDNYSSYTQTYVTLEYYR